ncbi:MULTISPECIES: hypothetical protein [unclassified Mycobacterium]|uniref:hypothetical protein n=1 Tax=unclassified Mycobacterium TaxID=2642494 RepID=UPI000B30E93E|nr:MULTISPECIES: hypothetical protein [unclassified Mycobacterium]
MTVNALDAYDLGYAMGSLMIPLIGLILLIIGLVQLTRSQKQPPPPPQPYGGHPQPPTQFGPPQFPPPPGFGPQGYPSYAQPPGAPAYPPPAGYWPPPRPKRRGMGLIITGAVILVLSLLVGGLRAAGSGTAADESTGIGHLDSGESLAVGQCVAQDEFGDGAPTSTDCSDPTATMELASLGGPDAECPDGKRRDATDYTTLFWDNATMCFLANLVEGECYAINMENRFEAPFIREDCAGSSATIRIVQRFDDTTDATQCPTATKPISYPRPARLYCLESLQ